MLPEQDGLARLDQVVELVGGPAGELVDHLAAARRAEDVRPVEHPGHRVHQVDVGLERLADARALDLDRDRLAAVERRPDGPGRSTRPRTRSGSNERKTVSGSAPSSCADDRADLGVGERRDLVEELEQLVAVGRRQQVEAERQHLAQLDPGSAQLLEGEPHPDRAAAAGRAPGRWSAGPMKNRKKTTRTCQDPARVPEQRPHAASAVSGAGQRMRSGVAPRALPGAAGAGAASSVRTPRHRGGRGDGGSGARSPPPIRGRPGSAPPSSGATIDRGGSSRPRRRAGLRARSGRPCRTPSWIRLSPSSKASASRRCRSRLRVGVALFVGRAVEPCLPAGSFARRPTRRSRPGSARAGPGHPSRPIHRRLARRISHVNHPWTWSLTARGRAADGECTPPSSRVARCQDRQDVSAAGQVEPGRLELGVAVERVEPLVAPEARTACIRRTAP